ncbi:hypothetical protein [Vibrio owensii]|uniref:hypothetical protein n=1 Tax=Vibrio owensii TaxID=696485 RepID=UPI0018F15C8E|nr:hypothetical protein [Vibrio owensii]
MFVSQTCNHNFFPIKASAAMLSDIKLVLWAENGVKRSVIYSRNAGGVLGDVGHQSPMLYGSGTQSVIDSGFVEGSDLVVFPCHVIDEGVVKLGFAPGYSIREWDTPVFRSLFVVYHMDSLQVVAEAMNLSHATRIVDSNPRYQSVFVTVKVLLDKESLVGRALWELVDDMQLFHFEGDGFEMQFADKDHDFALLMLQSRYKGLEVLHVSQD